MTTIYYVDFEGEAGTGDGTSFANRARNFHALGSSWSSYVSGDYEVRVAANPEYSRGNGNVRRRGYWNISGYGGAGVTSSDSYWVFSTTKGATGFRFSGNHYLVTGDFIEINGNNWYYTNSNFGDGSTNQVPSNRVGLNGLWKVTVSGEWIYLDEYTAVFNKAQSDSWSQSTHSQGTSDIFSRSTHGYWLDASGSVVDFATALPIENVCSNGDGRADFTVNSSVNVSYYQGYSWESWGNNTKIGMPPGFDVFYIDNGVGAGTKCFHQQLPATLDLSNYQGISMMIAWFSGSINVMQTVDATTHGQYSLRLCSDTAGATTVHKIPIDTRWINRTSNGKGWMTWENPSGNMNATINSVAIYKDTSVNTSVQFGINNVIAYKTADPLNHFHVVGLRTTDNNEWWTIKYIDKKSNAIKLLTSSNYTSDGRHEYGYYGSGYSVRWDQDRSGVPIYTRKAGLIGTWNTHTSYSSENQSNMNQSHEAIINTNGFGGGTATNDNVISGGWNRTDMSSQIANNPVTSLHGVYGNYYHGIRTNSSSSDPYLTWKDLSFHVFGGIYLNTPNTKIDNCFFDCMRDIGGLGGTNARAIGISLVHGRREGGFTLLSTSSQDNADTGTKEENYMLAWGANGGQSEWTFGRIGGREWSEIRNEASYPMKFYGESNGNATALDNIIIHKLVTGMCGRTSEGIRFEYVNNLRIKNWEGIYNYLQIQNNSEVIIEDMTYLKGNNATHRYGTQSEGPYCINWNSDKIQLLGGTTDKRIYFYKNAKLNNFTSTDSNEHYISSETGEVLSANHNGVSGAGRYIRNGWYLDRETSIRHTASGVAWKLVRTSSSYKPIFELAKIAVAASGTVTVKLWTYRTTTGTGTYAILRVVGDSILGITTTEMNTTNGPANQWYEAQVQVTPTTAGIMTVQVELVDSSNSGVIYFDDMTITQT